MSNSNVRDQLLAEADILETKEIKKEMILINNKRTRRVDEDIRMWHLYLMLAYRCIIDRREWTSSRHERIIEQFKITIPSSCEDFQLAYT